MTFAMVVAGRPFSLRAERPRSDQTNLRQAAIHYLGDQASLGGDLYVRIIWFHRRPAAQDVDNIAKLIIDALKGIVFADDRQVRKCVAERVDRSRAFDLPVVGPAMPAFGDLLTQLDREDVLDVLYVEVGPAATQHIAFGPIDGGD